MSMKLKGISHLRKSKKNVRSNAIKKGFTYSNKTTSEPVNFDLREQNNLVENSAHLLIFHTMLTRGSVLDFDACCEVRFKRPVKFFFVRFVFPSPINIYIRKTKAQTTPPLYLHIFNLMRHTCHTVHTDISVSAHSHLVIFFEV